jgi:acyl carrier protein
VTDNDAQVSAERWVIDACRDFKLPAGAAEDDFFSIGGTSITLIRLISRAEEEFGVALEPEEVLEASTLAGIAALLAR